MLILGNKKMELQSNTTNLNLKEDYLDLKALKKLVINGESLSEEWRRLQLKRLQNLIEENELEIMDMLNKDLEKPQTEAYFEIIALRQELNLVQANLRRWMESKNINVPFSFKPGNAILTYEPLGCVLIIGPWNYPFSLTLQPLISALAAGNTAVLKPSENAKNSSKLIKTLINKYFPKNIVEVVEGDGSIAEDLTNKCFDHIFFTGGGEIGKKIMKSAASNLIPITLELGGKSPALVMEDADLLITAKRLIWGKCVNSGQTCIAPDHILVHEKIKSNLINLMKKAIIEFYGESPLESNHLAKIINKHHFQRLKELINHSRNNQKIIFGGDVDESTNRISPTLIDLNNQEDKLMEEEIFGPLFPIVSFIDLDETINTIRNKPKPLAIYIFGGTNKEKNKIINGTSSGGVCINDVIMQAGIPNLPFGGIGASGMGRYHGYAGFQTFSNQKSIFKKPFWLDIKLRYPPYKLDLKWLKSFLG